LFHEDKFHHPEFLGLVHIPLGSFAVDELADKWYNLEKRPGLIDQKKVISGSVRLQVIYTTSLNALYAPMAVDGVKKPPLSTAHLRANIRRAQILWRSLQIDWWRSSYEEIMAWRKPMRTLLCFVSYSLLILSYPSSWLAPLIPLTMLMIMSANYVDARYNAADAKYGLVDATTAMDSDDEDDDDDDLDASSSSSDISLSRHGQDGISGSGHSGSGGVVNAVHVGPGLFTKVKNYKSAVENVQNQLGHICDRLEQIQGIFSWRDPQRSLVLFKVLSIVLLLMMVFPLRWLLFLLGIYRFSYHLIKRRTIGNAPYQKVLMLSNFVARAPVAGDSVSSELNLPAQLKKIK